MHVDRYTKFVLTIIAIALSVIALRMSTVPKVHAGKARTVRCLLKQPLEVTIKDSAKLPVVVKNWGSTSAIPVKITDSKKLDVQVKNWGSTNAIPVKINDSRQLDVNVKSWGASRTLPVSVKRWSAGTLRVQTK